MPKSKCNSESAKCKKKRSASKSIGSESHKMLLQKNPWGHGKTRMTHDDYYYYCYYCFDCY